jgi:phosphomannomutase
LDRFQNKVEILETAVGDRWLSFALSGEESKHVFVESESIPTLIGVEDSGHIVLPAPHPNLTNRWSFVGDGAMTLVAYLLAIHTCDEVNLMQRGWKKRQSVKNVDRSKWDGKNQFSNDIELLIKQSLGQHNSVSNWVRTTISGEANLMAITCNYGGSLLSIGIRNSGTQAKISVSARLEYGGSPNGIQITIDGVCQQLNNVMVIR